MPTKNPRINITFEEGAVEVLSFLAEQEQKSVASFAKELIFEALERREDVALSALADIRDLKGTKRVKHADAWK